MAEMNDDAARAYIEQLVKLNPELAKFFTLSTKLNKSFAQRIAADTIDAASKIKQRKAVEEFSKQILRTGSDGILGKFSKGLKNGFASLEDTKAGLAALDQAIENTTDITQKRALEEQRAGAASKAFAAVQIGAALDIANAIGKKAVGTVIGGVGKFTRGLQDGASATQLSAGLMEGAVDAATGAAGAVGSGLSSVGAVTSTASGKLKYLGYAASAAGALVSGLSEGVNKLAKFGIEILSKEVEKTVKAFNDVSSSGAMFSDGMTGMRNAAAGAGLTTDQFAAVVKENSTTLAASGLGVGEATRRMGSVSAESAKMVGTSGKTLQREMLQLGYSFEEQAALSAETLADLRKGGQLKNMSDKQVAQQTAEYATNLRTIAGITGEDARRKMEEARQASTQVAFRLKLQELEKKQPGITQKFMAGMQTMDATSKKALMEQMTLGVVIDKSANVMMQGSAAYGDKIQGMADLAESGAFTTEKAQQIQGEANDRMQGDLKNFREIGIAGMAGGLQDLNAAISGQVDNMDRVTKDSVKGAQEGAAGQKAATDQFTKDVMEAAVAAQKFKVDLQTALEGALGDYGKVSAAMLKELTTRIADATKALHGETMWDATKRIAGGGMGGAALGAAAGGTIGGIGGAVAGGVSGAALGGIGAVPGAYAGMQLGSGAGAAIGGIGGFLVGAIKEAFWGEPGKAQGGISSGPMSGYMEKLHGTEAVVPLSGGRSIPVQISYPESAGSASPLGAAGGGNDLSGLMQQQINLMRELIGKSTDQLDVFTTSRDIQQRLLVNSY